MSDELKENIKDQGTWMRGLYILMYAVIYSVTEIVIALVVIIQFLFVLITRQANEKLLALGAGLSTYIYQILSYVTFNSDLRPFPFSDFPDNTPASAPTVKKKKTVKKKAARKPVKESDDSKKITAGEDKVNDAD
ncbi:MAG: DUF4389 domain-containing protein [Gammaproteobacteria bacterium]|nr:DUF4389 domain-containing protein [Gammaproteobacteria bacterium]